jgi:imidazole glycerol-phosphate synthase subunit HisH
MTGVIDYDAGNITSVCNALKSLGASFFVSNKIEKLESADRILMPGVGEAQSAMSSLGEIGLVQWLKTVQKPFLGICLGMQVLYDRSDERDTRCLGIVDGTIQRFRFNGSVGDYKIPHMGWNTVDADEDVPLFTGIEPGTHFYFVHSYFAPIIPETIATADYGVQFTASLRKDNFYGVQFHPEKSGKQGLQILKNFIELC